MIHKYNTNQSIRFYYNQKKCLLLNSEYQNGRRHSIYLRFIPLLEQVASATFTKPAIFAPFT
jgi:hypothetical protein